MSQDTLDTIIADIANNLTTLSPNTLSEYGVKLSVLMTNLGDELVAAEMRYNAVWGTIRLSTTTDGRATKQSMTTDEYRAFRVCEVKLKSLKKLLRAIENRLNVFRDEAKNRY